MPFLDRADAARRLVEALRGSRGTHPLVLGIPRGGVPMAKIIADSLDGEVDVVLSRKIHAPGNPEFAIGAIDESGSLQLCTHVPDTAVDSGYIESQVDDAMETMRARRSLYLGAKAPVDPTGRYVIVVDDGLATGATMIAALRATRACRPLRLICAVPVGPAEAVRKVALCCDEMVCLEQPTHFYAVAQFYREFPQVDDAQVVAALRPASAGSHQR